MSIETELKFIVLPEVIATLPTLFTAWPHQHTAPQNLSNTYFETTDAYLRHHQMGLRIRGYNDHYEMTIKTAGSVVGGLHQRPEYNVTLSEPRLALQKFPAEIWPKECDLVALEQALTPIFSTDFQRESWVVTIEESDIEITLDQGEIRAGEKTEALCEMELELKHGDIATLLQLAATLSQNEGLRLSGHSKAARGYQLIQDHANQSAALGLKKFNMASKSTVEQGMTAALTWALEDWQHHEESWLRNVSSSRQGVLDAITMIRQIFVIFGGIIPRKASTELRSSLTALSERLSDEKMSPLLLCYSADYQQCKLALTSWLINKMWQPFTDAKTQITLNSSFKYFSDIMLGRALAELKSAFHQRMKEKTLKEQLPRLSRHLLAFRLFCGAYPSHKTTAFITQWQNLKNTIEENRQSLYQSHRQQALAQPPFWLNNRPY